MSRSNNYKLQLFAFDIDLPKWDNEIVYQLDMPETWKGWIRQLRKQESDYGLDKRVSPLGDKLKCIFPDLVSVDNRFYQEGNSKPWLIAVRPLPVNLIVLLVKAWLLKIASETKLPVPEEVTESELQWRMLTINEACSGDSSMPFNLLPSFVAHRFCETDKILQLKIEDEPVQLRFSKVFAKQNAECMSEPILTKSKHQFSYVVRYRLKTRGGEPNRHLLLVEFGIRRFITKPVNTEKLKGGVHSTLLVSMDNPYLSKEQGEVRSYASLSYRRQGREAPYTRWREGLDELFSELILGKKFTPEEILTNPMGFGENSNPRVMIIHNQQVYRSHSIGAGLSIGEKHCLFELVAQELSQWVPVEPLFSIPKPAVIKGKAKREIPPLLAPHAKDFILEIWGPDGLYQQAIESIREKKYNGNTIVEEVDSRTFRLLSPSGNRLILVKQEEQGYVDALDQAHGKEAFTHRANYIQRHLKHVKSEESVTLALIEILPKQNWAEGTDPKLSVREGYRRTGRLTQFIYPESVEQTAEEKDEDEEESQGAYKHKVFNAIMDLLSDAGVVDLKPMSEMGEVGTILAFDLVYVDSGIVPMMTKLERGELFVKGNGMSDWMPLQQAILNSHLLRSITSSVKQGKHRITRWFEEQLRWEKLNTEDFILLLSAHLRRHGLLPLTNNQNKDRNPPITSWIQEDPKISVIRINKTDEVPAYCFSPLSMATGVYSDETSGVYYGVGSKGVSQRNISKGLTKFHNPSKTFQQPKAIEYMPMGPMNEVERDRLAWIVQWMREMCISFETTATLPYPLKMFKSLEKYIQRNSKVWDEEEAEFV